MCSSHEIQKEPIFSMTFQNVSFFYNNINIWYVIYILLWIKYKFRRVVNYCIPFVFTICTVSNFFGMGFVLWELGEGNLQYACNAAFLSSTTNFSFLDTAPCGHCPKCSLLQCDRPHWKCVVVVFFFFTKLSAAYKNSIQDPTIVLTEQLLYYFWWILIKFIFCIDVKLLQVNTE